MGAGPWAVMGKIERAKYHSRIGVTLVQEGQWRADGADYDGGDEAISRGVSRVVIRCCGYSYDEAASDDRGQPCGMPVVHWMGNVDADDRGAVQTVTGAGWAVSRIAEEIRIGGAGEAATERSGLRGVNEDVLSDAELLDARPLRVGGLRERRRG